MSSPADRLHPGRLALGAALDLAEAFGYYGLFALLSVVVLSRVRISEAQIPFFYIVGNLGALAGGVAMSSVFDRVGHAVPHPPARRWRRCLGRRRPDRGHRRGWPDTPLAPIVPAAPTCTSPARAARSPRASAWSRSASSATGWPMAACPARTVARSDPPSTRRLSDAPP